jgi:hypothetical protein
MIGSPNPNKVLKWNQVISAADYQSALSKAHTFYQARKVTVFNSRLKFSAYKVRSTKESLRVLAFY